MDDLISRQQAIDVIESGRLTKLIDAETAVNGLRALPPAQQWIPTSEKLPEMTDTYLVQVGINENGEGMHTEVRTADWNAVWQTWYVHTTRCLVGDIIKWMPIPWKGGPDEH